MPGPRKVSWIIPGKPVAWMRPNSLLRKKPKRSRRTRNVWQPVVPIVTLTPAAQRDWFALVGWNARKYWPGAPTKQPVEVTLLFAIPIPDSYSKAARSMALGGFLLPTKTPDLDNLIKGVLDGMKGIVFNDDAQVIETQARMMFANDKMPEGVLVRVIEMAEQFLPVSRVDECHKLLTEAGGVWPPEGGPAPGAEEEELLHG